MDKEESQKLKDLLTIEMNSIEKQLSEFTSENPMVKGDRKSHFHETDPSDPPADKAHSVTEFEEERAVEQNLELRLKEIKETIKKLDEGTYGICENCASPIDTRRLEVMPVARFCVDCGKKVKFI